MSSVPSIRPHNWSSFQHYKDRSPAWVKLHKSILDNYDFHCLPDASKALAPLLWLLASEYDNGDIPADMPRIAFRMRMAVDKLVEALKPLIDKGFFIMEQCASNPLAACLPREEKEVEKEKESPPTPPAAGAAGGEARPIVKIKAKGEKPADAFERFWQAWPASPRKVGKADCVKRWKRRNLDEHAESILAHVQAMAATQQWRDGFDPSPATYLNQRRWEDGVPADRPSVQPGQTQTGDWWESSTEIERRAAEAGLKRGPDEGFHWFKCRVAKACKERRWMDLILADLLRTKSSHYARVYEYFNGNPPTDAA